MNLYSHNKESLKKIGNDTAIEGSNNKLDVSKFSLSQSIKLKSKRNSFKYEEGDVESGELDDCIEGSIP